MKNPQQNAARWMRQAEYDMDQAVRMLREGVFAYAAFFAEQAAQKALTAFLYARGSRRVSIPSIGELAKQAAAREDADEAVAISRGVLEAARKATGKLPADGR